MFKVYENHVDVIGKTWQGFKGYLRYTISKEDLCTIKQKDKNEKFTIKNFERWLENKAGDFDYIIDYAFVIDSIHRKKDFKTEEGKKIFMDIVSTDF